MGKDKNRRFPALDDWHLWNEVTSSVSPLPSKILIAAARAKIKAEQRREKLKTRKSPDKKPDCLALKRSGAAPKPGWSLRMAPIHQPPVDRFIPAIEPKLHRKLRRGRLPIDATLDLHGMHQNEARSALQRFVDARLKRGDRTILVITGKGLKKTGYGAIEQSGVLRHMLPLWLREPGLAPHIAGWEVSARHHGGEGAYYIRLKRARS